MNTITDPVFGELTQHRQSWIGHFWLEFRQQNCEIELEYIGGQPPSIEEQQAFLRFLENQHSRMQAIEQAIFHYCLENTERYRSHYETNPESRVPALQTSSEIWQQLRILRFYIDSSDEDAVVICIVCDFA